MSIKKGDFVTYDDTYDNRNRALTHGKVYEVLGTAAPWYVTVKNDNGREIGYLSGIFKKVEPQPEFKKGDWVECVNADGYWHVTAGKCYAVRDVVKGEIRIVNDLGNLQLYPGKYFKLSEKPQPEIRKGDWVECIDSGLWIDIKVGAVYEVLECEGSFIEVINAMGSSYSYPVRHFKLSEKPQPEIKKGDWVECIDDLGMNKICKGEQYEVADVLGTLIGVITNTGDRVHYDHKRFKLSEKPQPKYVTVPISYEGCHPVIAEYLQRNEGILCDVSDDSKSRMINAYREGATYPYRSDNGRNHQTATPTERDPLLKVNFFGTDVDFRKSQIVQAIKDLQEGLDNER